MTTQILAKVYVKVIFVSSDKFFGHCLSLALPVTLRKIEILFVATLQLYLLKENC